MTRRGTLPITRGQIWALNKLLTRYTTADDVKRCIVVELTGVNIENLSDLSQSDWAKIRDMAYENWSDGDWTLSRKFGAKVASIVEKYNKEVLGQLPLFGDD